MGNKRVYETFDAALARFRLMPEQLCENPFIVEFIGRHSLRRAEDGWVWKFDSEAMGSRRFGEPVREYLQAVGCRAALIFGEKSALVSRETASYMSSLMGPRAPVVEVPEARHHVGLDQPLGFVAALRMLLYSWMRNERVRGGKRLGRCEPHPETIPRLVHRVVVLPGLALIAIPELRKLRLRRRIGLRVARTRRQPTQLHPVQQPVGARQAALNRKLLFQYSLRVDPAKRHHPVPRQLGASDNPFREPRTRRGVDPGLSTRGCRPGAVDPGLSTRGAVDPGLSTRGCRPPGAVDPGLSTRGCRP